MQTIVDALGLLVRLGAPPHLVKHHALVAEAAVAVCEGLRAAKLDRFEVREVLLGAAVHDAGKIEFPQEMHAAGNEHESTGRRLLAAAGVDDRIARHCELHAAWVGQTEPEPLLVAVADKVWKGKRVPDLEEALVRALAERHGRDFWDTFGPVDAILETVAESGPARLMRSVEY